MTRPLRLSFGVARAVRHAAGRRVVRALWDAWRPPRTPWTTTIERRREELMQSTQPFAERPDHVVPSTTVGEHARRASKSPRWCAFLYRLVRGFRPTTCVEMGTAVGISGSYIAAALHDQGAGTLVTIEGNAASAEIARETFQAVGLANVQVVNGLFAETLRPVLQQQSPVDFLFVDGHKDGQAQVQYFEWVRPMLAPHSVVVFDDIRRSADMWESWERIRGTPETAMTVDLGALGVWVRG